LPKYPAVKRDIAIILRENISAQQVKEVIISSGGDLLERVELFDVYQQKPIPPNYRSLAYTLTFRSPEKTLTDQEVDSVQQKIIETLSANLDAKIRK
jgi:phenylalanyl-tRNA synthetase beta chain